MKISHRTHPVLQKVEEGRLGKIMLWKEDEWVTKNSLLVKEMKENFSSIAAIASQNIRYITKPFAEAISLAWPKLSEGDMFGLDSPEWGVLISGNLSQVYYVGPFSETKHGKRITFSFFDGVLVGYTRQVVDTIGNEPPRFTWVSSTLLERNGLSTSPEDIEELDSRLNCAILAALSFIKYCPVETRYLKWNGRIKDEIGCKYVNDTKSNITIYDSRWFTDLVRSEGFKVRGHFRFQPYGEGHKNRKLIWVNEFNKHGYTAPARKTEKQL